MPLRPESRLISCSERQVGVWLPVPLSARLDALARIGHYAWAPTTRKEIVSALMLDAPADGKKLKNRLEKYRRASVRDAFVEGTEEWRFLYPPGSPGPRRQLALHESLEQPEEEPVAQADEQLSTARAYRIGMYVASPLAARLNLLVRLARGEGVPATRKDLVAALVLAAPTDGRRLAGQLSRYWHGTVGDAVIPALPSDPIVRF